MQGHPSIYRHFRTCLTYPHILIGPRLTIGTKLSCQDGWDANCELESKLTPQTQLKGPGLFVWKFVLLNKSNLDH